MQFRSIEDNVLLLLLLSVLLQVRLNKLKNIGAPNLRATNTEAVAVPRARAKRRVDFRFHRLAGFSNFLAQDAVWCQIIPFCCPQL